MKTTIIAVGKVKEKYLVQGIEEYAKRMGNYTQFDIIEVVDEPTPDHASDKVNQQIKEKEGERILAKLPKEALVYALAIEGKLYTSEQLAREIKDHLTYGTSHIVFIIGGSLGLSPAVLQQADKKLSFGRLTLPHQLMRLVLTEQIYRTCRINAGHAYHK